MVWALSLTHPRRPLEAVGCLVHGIKFESSLVSDLFIAWIWLAKLCGPCAIALDAPQPESIEANEADIDADNGRRKATA
jgi:hypothetical protein